MRDLTTARPGAVAGPGRAVAATRARSLAVAVNLSASSLVDLELPRPGLLRSCSAAACPSASSSWRSPRTSSWATASAPARSSRSCAGLGIRVAVDDFGTGYSSLAYLRELPIDELKLDRSFVQPMAEDPRAAAIVRSTIGLAHSLGMTLVAEGVEDEATADHLALSGCDESQGFYYSRPLPSHDLETWLDQHELKRQSVLASQPAGGATNHPEEIVP